MNPETRRLQETHEKNVPWKKWGPYLSERQGGTVREDFSDNGDAWNYFSTSAPASRQSRQTISGVKTSMAAPVPQPPSPILG
jgi:hypothetical protein